MTNKLIALLFSGPVILSMYYIARFISKLLDNSKEMYIYTHPKLTASCELCRELDDYRLEEYREMYTYSEVGPVMDNKRIFYVKINKERVAGLYVNTKTKRLYKIKIYKKIAYKYYYKECRRLINAYKRGTIIIQ